MPHSATGCILPPLRSRSLTFRAGIFSVLRLIFLCLAFWNRWRRTGILRLLAALPKSLITEETGGSWSWRRLFSAWSVCLSVAIKAVFLGLT